MKLLFIACRPSPEFQQALDLHKLATTAVDSPAAATGPAELVAWKVDSQAELRKLAALRQAHPDAWIALIVPQDWLADAAAYSSLLAATDKDDVWFEAQWETGFWIGLQRAVQNRASRHREKRMQDELEKIKLEQESLLSSSEALIQRMEGDADLAAQVHRKFYPRFSPDVPGVEVYSKYLPASGSGGGYFDLFEFGDKRRFGMLLADGSSHRSAASLLSVLLKVRLDDLRSRFTDSASFLKHLNDAVAQEQPKAGGTLKVSYGVFDRASLVLELTCAGAIAPRRLRAGKLETLEVHPNPPMTADHAWTATKLQLQPGDTLVLFSDGLEKTLAAQSADVDALLGKLGKQKDTLEIRNRLLAEIDASRAKVPLSDDLTFILISVDARALFVAPAIPLRRV